MPDMRTGIHSSNDLWLATRLADQLPSSAVWFSAPSFQASLADSWSSQVWMNAYLACRRCRSASRLYCACLRR